MKTYTVTEITRYIKDLLENDEVLMLPRVSGEISNLSRSTNGHCYFVLKDAACQLSCALFRGNASRINVNLRDGLKVEVQGRIEVYDKVGKYQLIVETLKEEGAGELYEKFLKLKKKLHAEGLFDESIKKPLPFFPRLIGVVTSPYGAVIRDIITTLKKRNDTVSLILAPVLVQGGDAAESIVKGLKLVQEVPGIELIILCRGGGSFEELMPFNDEQVARALFGCPLPTISAVGHETDFTITDMVADRRAPTPTAAAQMAVPEKTQLQEKLENQRNRMKRTIEKMMQGNRMKLDLLASRGSLTRPEGRLNNLYQTLDLLFSKLPVAFKNLMSREERKLSHLRDKLDAYNPMHVVTRGYSIIHRVKDGTLIKSVTDLSIAEELKITLKDGSVKAEVLDISRS
jgi:exodeoxyribonuclease VII large subunit